MESMLGVFGQSTEYIAHLKVNLHALGQYPAPGADTSANYCGVQTILDNSSSPYAQHMAATSLLKLATEHSLRYACQHVAMSAQGRGI